MGQQMSRCWWDPTPSGSEPNDSAAASLVVMETDEEESGLVLLMVLLMDQGPGDTSDGRGRGVLQGSSSRVQEEVGTLANANEC